MRLLDVEVRVTITYGCRIGTVDVRVQIGDTRTRDAHVICQTDVLRRRNRVRERCCRHKTSVVGTEVGTRTKTVFHFLPSMLVTHTCLCSELAPLSTILCIACKHGVLVRIVHAHCLVIDVVQIVFRV